MKVFIASSANLTIDEKYVKIASQVAELFATKKFDLMFGAANYSMMGACYKAFVKHDRKIIACTVSKYERDFKKLIKAKCIKTPDTLERFRKLYFKSDFIIILPGGIGTLAEFSSAVEEYRASSGDKRIILFNYDGYYNGLIDWMKQNIDTGFFIDDLTDCFDIVSSIDDLEKIVDNYKKNYNLSKRIGKKEL